MYGLINAMIESRKKNTTIGLLKNMSQLPSKMTKDCLKVPSTNSPKIKPIITGTTEKPNLLIKKPIKPNEIIIQTSIIDWLNEYVPHTDNVKIIGHSNLLGIRVTLANILAPKKPKIKNKILANNIAPKIP